MNNLIGLAEKFTLTQPFLFASSTTVFAPPTSDTAIISVNNPIEGASQYTKDKIECENLLRQSKLEWSILRLSVVMNPTFRPTRASVHYGLLIAVDTPVEPIHVQDVATAFFHAAMSPHAAHKIFIIAGGEKVRMFYKDYIVNTLKVAIPTVTEKDVPWELFTGQKKNYLHWYDTKESQLLLDFQHKTFDDYSHDAKKALRWYEKLAIFLLGRKLARLYFR